MDKELIERIQNKKHYYENVEALEKHLDTHFKSDEITVFHEMVSLDFHLDVYFIQPKDEDFNLLITSGMSLLEMKVPDTIQDKEDYAFAELLIILPKDLEFEKTFPSEGKNDWIISLIKEMARFPHHQDTFLTEGHSLQAWSDISEPYDETLSLQARFYCLPPLLMMILCRLPVKTESLICTLFSHSIKMNWNIK
ncbi:suppressor of fused domain protein [Chryseobacterium tructae]|nr:suppressor of fused domain protein [Chryseobacterium tructae]MDN3693592.1 suppressor of fused domain protein [Chryseobacterium tructae]